MFAGIIIRHTRKQTQDFATADLLKSILTPYDQADRIGSWSNSRALLVQALAWNTAESRNEQTPEVCKVSGRIIVSLVRLDNRDDLCNKLQLNSNSVLTDPQIILASYAKWGTDCANQLEGDFSFAIYDPRHDVLYCARDSVGAAPFFYYVNSDVFIFASTAAIFPRINTIDISISQEWLARYLLNVSHDRVKTAFTSVKKLPSAHCAEVHLDGEFRLEPYFEFKNTAPFVTTRDPKWVTHYREVFDQVVSHRLRSAYHIGAETSGGIDSSSIIASASTQLPHSVDDFHLFGLSHLQQEPEYILETSVHCGISKNHIFTAPAYFRSQETMLRGIRTLGYPAENGLTTLYKNFFEEAQLHNIRSILSGFGGDEIVTSKAEKFFEELFAAKAWRTLLRELPGNYPMRLARLVRLARNSTMDRSQMRSAEPMIRSEMLSFVSESAIAEYGLVSRVITKAAHVSGPSMGNLALTHLSDKRFGGELSGRLESFALMAQSYGISYRWPMLDRRLIQLFLDVPTIEKNTGRVGRYLHRRAFDGDVPSKVLWKPTKNMGLFAHFDHQEYYDINGLIENLNDKLLAIIDKPAIMAKADKLKMHHQGKQTMLLRDYVVGYQLIKNLSELNCFLQE